MVLMPQSLTGEKHNYTKNMRRRLMNHFRRDKVIKSYGSENTYQDRFKVIERYLKENHPKYTLSTIKIHHAIRFLKKYRYLYKPNTMRGYTMALQFLLRKSGELGKNKTLVRIESKVEHFDASRAYSYKEMMKICNQVAKRNAISIKICYFAGLRAHELLTISEVEDQEATPREANKNKFIGLLGKEYTVNGKGGLIRIVMLPWLLVVELEARRLPFSKKVIDRKIVYYTNYDIGAGKKLSSAFTYASKKVLGFSRGLHGMRHSYAQNRYETVKELTNDIDLALVVVSQELGHFRKNITLVYLR